MISDGKTQGPEYEDRAADRVLDIGPFWIGMLTTVVVLVSLIAISWDDVSQPRFEDGDFAANSILIDKASSLSLVHGNYSRAGFYHPGPALLTVQAVSQVMLFDGLGWVPTPYNAHLVGILALNAALLGIAAAILHSNTGTPWSAALLVAIASAYSLQFETVGLGGLLTTTWMPSVYVWPFLVMLVGGASVALGRAGHLWAYFLGAGLLVHGHVSFFLPVIGISVALAAVLVWHHRGGRTEISKPSLLAALIVLAVLVFPLIAQLVTDFPGQFDDYITYTSETELPARSVEEVVGYVGRYWALGSASYVLVPVLILLAIASVLKAEHTGRMQFGLSLIAICGAATITTLTYAYVGIDDLSHVYLAYFYIAVPVLVWTTLGFALLGELNPEHKAVRWLIAGVLATAFVIVLIQPGSQSAYAGSDVGTAYEAVDETLGPGDTMEFSFVEHEMWPATVGLVEQARRDERLVCASVELTVFILIFTPEHVCKHDTTPARGFLVASRDFEPEENADLVFTGDGFTVWRYEP